MTRRRLVLACAGIVLWYACTLAFWAFRSFTDAVPVGVDQTVKPAQPLSVTFTCHAPAQPQARTNTPLPALKPQPVGLPALAYARAPCVRRHRDERLLLGVDTALVIVLLGGAGWFALRAKAAADARPVPA